MPNFTSPGERVRYQGSDAQIVCGEMAPSNRAGALVFRGCSVVREAGQPAQYAIYATSGPVLTNRIFAFRTLGVSRWYFQTDAVAEAGADSGTNYVLSARDDLGAQIDVPWTVERAAGGLLTFGSADSNRPLTLDVTDQGLRFENQVTGAGAGAGALANAPAAGPPTFWLPLNIAGVVRFWPLW